MRTEILKVPFDVITKEQALHQLMSYLKTDELHMIFTPNPEFVMTAQQDAEFLAILQKADLSLADGIGILLASKLNTVKIKERVTGCDLAFALFDKIKDMEHTLYLLGGKPGVCERAKQNLEQRYKKIKIIGCHHGYFNEEQEKLIVQEIQDKKPDIVMVFSSFPNQEKWIAKHRDVLPAKIIMGLGGSIDIMAGTVKRAPFVFRKLGLEWFFRLISEPKRFFRMIKLPLFVVAVIQNKVSKEH